MNQSTITESPTIKISKLYPWLIWALSSSFLFYKYLLQVSPTVMVQELMATFSLSGLSMGNLAAFYFYAYLAMQLPVGILLDNFSPRRLVACAIAVCAVGALLFAKADTLGIAETGRLLIGLGGAFSAVGTMKLITLWFPPKRFALVSGLMMTVGMLGAVGGEAPLASLVEHVGWRDAMFYAAIVGFCLALLIFITVRDKKTKTGKETKHFLANLKRLVNNPQCWLIALYSGLAFAPISAFAGLWGVPFLMEKYGMGRVAVGGLVSLVFIGFAIGSPLAGWFSDFIGRRKPLMALGTTAGMLTLLVILFVAMPVDLLGICLFVFGFFTSFFFISFATIREINPLIAGGTAIGFINMFNALFGALSEPLVGKLLDLHWSGTMLHGARVFSAADYQMGLMLLPIAMLLAVILLFFVKETRCCQV